MLQNKSPVTPGLEYVLNVGTFFGIMPKTNFQYIYSLYTLIVNLIILVFAVILFFRDISTPDANLVEQFLDMAYHSHILLTIITCIHQSRIIPSVLETWDEVEILLRLYEKIPEKNQNHKSHTIKITKIVTVVYVSCVFIGAFSYFITICIKENTQDIQSYLNEVSKIYILPEFCGTFTGYYVLFIGIVLELLWAYGDMLVLLFSLNLYYQFKRFNNILKEKYQLEDLRLLHWEMAKATKKTNKGLRILTTTIFICNILYLFSRVYNGIEEDLRHPNIFINFEAIYALSYLIIRIFATAIIATMFASESTAGFRVVTRYETDSELDYLLVDRFCNQLLTANLAINGSGYFYLNRGFIATLISALVTYEVVILQFSVAARSSSANCTLEMP